ncbi:MAG: hypothetical protein J0L55_00660 [Caulobacterales bacterium]|nr:hypothetical protein [Caulobacterales bacterium]MCA0372264.1 hypothetical protein [Pseudomonadota bacterium]
MEIHIAQDRIIYFVTNDEIDKLINKKILTTKIDIGSIYLRFALIIENSKEEIEIDVDSDGYVLKIAKSALPKFFDVSRGQIAIRKSLKINEKNIIVGAAVINKEN